MPWCCQYSTPCAVLAEFLMCHGLRGLRHAQIHVGTPNHGAKLPGRHWLPGAGVSGLGVVVGAELICNIHTPRIVII